MTNHQIARWLDKRMFVSVLLIGIGVLLNIAATFHITHPPLFPGDIRW